MFKSMPGASLSRIVHYSNQFDQENEFRGSNTAVCARSLMNALELDQTVDSVVRIEGTSSKLTLGEKSITAQWFRTGNLQISSPPFSCSAIATAGVLMVKIWFLSPTEFSSYRPKLPLKPEDEAVELWLEKIGQ